MYHFIVTVPHVAISEVIFEAIAFDYEVKPPVESYELYCLIDLKTKGPTFQVAQNIVGTGVLSPKWSTTNTVSSQM